MILGGVLELRLHFKSILYQTRLVATARNIKNKDNYFDLNSLIKRIRVTYKTGNELQNSTTIISNYVDTGITSNTKGTVVTISGSPGSHNDFKYMKSFFEKKNIRMICTNWPGSEYVTGGLNDTLTNIERNSYLENFMKILNLHEENKLVLIGHSRGAENALKIASNLSVGKSHYFQ
uniref:Uncharacterized protein n=1 Tax=Caenorhabditis japonica TaxID=281687 RepID=A0A8R1IUH8_CAEJA